VFDDQPTFQQNANVIAQTVFIACPLFKTTPVQYIRKAVRAIGKIQAIAVASMREGRLIVQVEEGTVTEDMKNQIRLAIEDAKRYSYDLTIPNRYFFVDQFVDTLFEKKTPNAPIKIYPVKRTP
jgi:hypothetical protein